MRMSLLRSTLAAVGFVAAVGPNASAADTLSEIVERGSVAIGVKADFPPFGMRDSNGNLVGLEIDLGKDLAERLSKQAGKPIAANFVVVASANRMEFLEQGRIDVLLANMTDTAERRKVVGIVQPNYYSSGIAVFARNDAGLDGWGSLNGKPICGIQGAWFNKDYGTKNGADMVTFKGVPEAEAALLAGRCVGWLYDDSAFAARKASAPDKWGSYSLVTPVTADAPWGAAVRKDDLGQPISAALSNAIIDWHKSGLLADLQKKWGLNNSSWVATMKEKCASGDKVCDANADE